MTQFNRSPDSHKKHKDKPKWDPIAFRAFLCFLWSVFFIAFAGTASAATNHFAQVSTTETNVFLGQVFSVDVIVKAPEKPEAPDLSDSTDFNATLIYAGKPTSATNTWVYRYALRAKQEGELTLPALRFGSIYSNPLTIQAKKPAATDRMKIEQTLSKKSIYVGEPVLLTTIWDSTYQFGAIKAVDFHFPILNDPRFQTLELYAPDQEKQSQATGLPLHGTRVLAMRNTYQDGETTHQTLTFSKLLIPKKSGKLVVPPSTLLCAAEQEKDTKNARNRRSAFQYPAYFDNTFFDQNVTGGDWQRIYTESQPLELEVKPLPTEGRPALFNGMVGEFSIQVEAEPTDVRIGEPITLTITVAASNHMENIFFERLRYQPNLINRFEIPSDRSLPERRANAKVYTQTIRPISQNTTEIPPIQLAYFSPASNAYITAQSAPIPIRVSPAETVDVYGGTAYKNRLRTVEKGIRQNYENPDMLKNRRRPMFGWAHPTVVLLVLIFPPLIVGSIGLVSLLGEKKHHIHRTAKAARAYKVFRKNAAHIYSSRMKSEIYNDLDRVLRAYLGDRLHLNPGALSFRDAEPKLIQTGADFQTLKELRNLFALCEAYRFTSTYDEPGDAKKIVRNAMHIVRSVERELTSLECGGSTTLLNKMRLMGKRRQAAALQIALLLLALPTFGMDYQLQTLEDAHAAFRSATNQTMYAEAAQQYEFLIQEEGIHNGQLFYTTGNSWFMAGDMGRAILNYRRAERYLPGNDDVQHNLKSALELRTDLIPKKEPPPLVAKLLGWHLNTSTALRWWLFVPVWLAFWSACFWMGRTDKKEAKITVFATGVLSAVLLTSLLTETLMKQKARPGVIVAEEVLARKGDGPMYAPAFLEPLHAGTEFQTLETRGKWRHIRLADGQSCWIPLETAETL